MDDVALVHGVEATSDVSEACDLLRQRQVALLDERREVAALDQLGDDVHEPTRGDLDIDDPHDVGVIELCDQLSFPGEARGHLGIIEVGQDLEGEGFVVAGPTDLVDRSGRTRAQGTHDLVAMVDDVAWSGKGCIAAHGGQAGEGAAEQLGASRDLPAQVDVETLDRLALFLEVVDPGREGRRWRARVSSTSHEPIGPGPWEEVQQPHPEASVPEDAGAPEVDGLGGGTPSSEDSTAGPVELASPVSEVPIVSSSSGSSSTTNKVCPRWARQVRPRGSETSTRRKAASPSSSGGGSNVKSKWSPVTGLASANICHASSREARVHHPVSSLRGGASTQPSTRTGTPARVEVAAVEIDAAGGRSGSVGSEVIRTKPGRLDQMLGDGSQV